MERHPLRANNLFCRKVEASLGNLIPLPIDKSSEDSDEGKCAKLVTAYLQAVILGSRCKYFFVVGLGEPRECADASEVDPIFCVRPLGTHRSGRRCISHILDAQRSVTFCSAACRFVSTRRPSLAHDFLPRARKPFIHLFVGHVKLRYARARARDLFS